MLRGLLEKALLETRWVVLVSCLALAAVLALLVRVLPQLAEGLDELVVQVPLLRAVIAGLTGMDVSEGLAPRMLLVVVWTHPIVLAIVWGFAVVLGTRVPAGEIERGTVDVLLGWPVSRGAVYAAEVLVSLAAGALLVASGCAGFAASAAAVSAELRPALGRTLLVLVNLYALHVFVGALVQCIASACDRRGQAMGLAVAFLLASYLVQFLSALWAPAASVSFLSFAHYYQPARLMLDGASPVRDVLVLVVAGGVLWGLGAAVWRRRSVATT